MEEPDPSEKLLSLPNYQTVSTSQTTKTFIFTSERTSDIHVSDWTAMINLYPK
jgi:hypothetical protein